MTSSATNPGQTVRALIAQGNLAAAEEVCKAHLATAAPGAETFILEGLRHRLGRQLNEAAIAYDTALSLAPDALAAYQGLAEILAEKGWLFSAILVMEDARSRTAFTPEAHAQLNALDQQREAVVRAAREAAT